MAEIIFQRKKIATIFSEPNPLIILLIFSLLSLTCSGQIQQPVNRLPHFLPQIGDMSQFSISEDTQVGTPIYQLKGVDPEDGKLRYSISGQHLIVDPDTGVVTLAKQLDREEQSSIEVIISITDEPFPNTEPNTVSLRRVIPIIDVNDNPPVFHNRPYSVNISEATVVGSEIELKPKIIVTDFDEGDNAEIKVTCSDKGDPEACTTFNVVTSMLSPNQYRVRIYLAKPLDYESRSAYVINLEAQDISEHPLKTTASVAVTVYDVQDQPPVFMNAPYSATVQENTAPNTEIMTIVAIDGDKSNPRPVLLTIEGDDKQFFRLVPEKPIGRATLVTWTPIDRESDAVAQNGGVYSFTIKATELINNEVPAEYTFAPVTIIVSDVDDHVPEFNSDVFNISIPENIENGSPIPGLSIYVEDFDAGQNSKYELSMKNVLNSEDVFYITPGHGEGRTSISVRVKDSSKLDYDVDNEDKRRFVFEIIASHNGEELSSTVVKIKLLDVNDNSPMFEKPSYKLKVAENAEVGDKIADIEATDKDFGIFGHIEYSLTGFGANLFKTDKEKGGIYVRDLLDYERQKSYSLTLLAKDGGGKAATAGVFIDVIDVNDNAPVFELSEYTRTIRDGASIFEPQFFVRATDADGKTQGNGKVRYSIMSDNSIKRKGHVFNIDKDTGEITIIDSVDSMDTPKGQYELIVRATDYGKPPLFEDTTVLVRVGVPGNERPTYEGNYHQYVTNKGNTSIEDANSEVNRMNYKASIKENAKAGDAVTMVKAHDPDGLDDFLRYHIVTGSKDNFVIDEVSGLITVSSEAHLDRDVNSDRYEIIVAAVDSGNPIPETATTTVFVTIEDVNDKPPKFNLKNQTRYLSENTKNGTQVTTIVATDSDINSKLQFSLVEPTKAFSKAGVQLKPNPAHRNLFRIDKDTGKLFVNGTLDYSQLTRIILTIKVEDINAELNKDTQFATMEYTIYIQPYADKNPRFVNPGWTASNPIIHQKIIEEQPLGSTVLVLMADDPVSGHLVSNYKVINSETNLLQVDPLSGQVVLTKHLDYEELLSPNLTLTVKATSNDGSKSSVAKIIIEVINLNDNAPAFEKELYTVSVLESIVGPAHILTVKAVDRDAVLSQEDKAKGYSDVRYSLLGENGDLFAIDKTTGVIQVAPNKTLDREKQSVLRVLVKASDMPNGGTDQLSSMAVVLIHVLDVDDNTPAFEKMIYTAVVPENVHIGHNVINVTATDPDEGLSGEIKYEFLDEGELNGYLSINSKTGEIKTQKQLTGKGRTNAYRLMVVATDGGGHTGDATLLLYVGDVSSNDGVPRFIRPLTDEILKISENATIGTPVYQVVASDPDDPTLPSGQLYYSIQQTNPDASVFAVDPHSGIITLRQSLDREKKDSYILVLQVTDRGSPPQQSIRIIKFTITDVDDHKPHFLRNLDDPPIVFTVEEEVPVRTFIGEVKAIDEDIGENAQIDYAITVGNEKSLVKLERTKDNRALIITSKRIDREAIARLVLTIKCFKYDSRPRMYKTYNRYDPSEIQVLIKVIDLDDHLPEFESANMTFGVRLNVPANSVIGTLKAIDRDPDALPINYNIVKIHFESPIKARSTDNVTDVISLNNSTGELKVMSNLIHYADGIFRLIVRANNSGDRERHTDIQVEVVVVRERDLLRLVLDNGRRGKVNEIKQQIENAIAEKGLKMQLHDSYHSEFYTNPGPCFQFRKTSTGEALTPNAMKSIIRSLGPQFQQILEGHHVHNITGCGETHAKHTNVQQALLYVTAGLPLAGLAAIIVLCCMYYRAKSRTRAALLVREPPVSSSNISAPTRLYSEPLYTT